MASKARLAVAASGRERLEETIRRTEGELSEARAQAQVEVLARLVAEEAAGRAAAAAEAAEARALAAEALVVRTEETTARRLAAAEEEAAREPAWR